MDEKTEPSNNRGEINTVVQRQGALLRTGCKLVLVSQGGLLPSQRSCTPQPFLPFLKGQ